MGSARDNEEAEPESGLPWYALKAPSEVMRSLADIARRRGFTLGKLAKRYSETTEAGNVRQHFRAKNPRGGTVKAYAKALGVPDAALFPDLFSAAPLPEQRVRGILRRVKDRLQNEDPIYTEGAVRRAIEWLDAADVATAERLARAYQKAYSVAPDYPIGGRDPLDALCDLLPRELDLREHRRPRNDLLAALWSAWDVVELEFGDDVADNVAALIIGMIDHTGKSTEELWRELRRASVHRREQKRGSRAGA